MNDEELRAFLESASKGDPEPQQQSNPIEPATSGEPPATSKPGESARPAAPVGGQQAGLSFDELIGLRRRQAADADPVPLVLPEPKRASSPDSGVTPLLLPPAGTPARAAQPAAMNDPQPPTQPLSQADMPTPKSADTRPAEPIAPAIPVFAQAPVPAASRPAPELPVVPASSVPPTAPLPQADESSIFGLLAATDASTPASDEYEKIAVTGGTGGKKMLPWIIVGAGAAIALVASIFIVNALGGGTEPTPTAAPTATETPTTGSTPSASPSPSTDPEPSETADDQPPQVEVGPTMVLDVPFWGITADLSTRFGQTSYVIDADSRLVLNSALISSLPESCAAMRSEWGISRVGDATFEVLKPAQRCAEAPELYDEIWGLSAAMVESIRPL